MQQRISPLLDEVAFKIGTLRAARNRFSDRLAPEFSIFDYLRTDEMGLSRCIASLLDPKGKHGQGYVFLEAFLECIGSAAAWAKNAGGCLVVPEKQANGQRRIDIYLEFPNGAIGIENKPWAGDQDCQLTDYACYLKKSAGAKRWLLLFLCDRDPSENSMTRDEREKLSGGGQFVRCNYSEIIEWLEICACKSKALNVRVFIEELAKFIRVNINGELDMSEEKEACNIILKSKDSLSSAFEIYKAIDGVKKNLMNKFRDDLESELKSLGFHLVWDKNLENKWQSNVGFGVKFRQEQNLYLRFEFEYSGLNGLFWGIRRESDSIKNDPDIWSPIRGLMANLFSAGRESEWWPWYSTNTKDGLDVDVKDWWKGELPWAMILDDSNDRLIKKVSRLACRVHDTFAEKVTLLSAGVSLNTLDVSDERH